MSVPSTAPGGTSETPPLPQIVAELRDLVVAYFKQETIVPLRQLGRYVAMGVLGSLLLGLGAVLLGMAGLRALQGETGSTFTGNWSWAPYGIVFVGMTMAGAITWKARGVQRGRRERKDGR